MEGVPQKWHGTVRYLLSVETNIKGYQTVPYHSEKTGYYLKALRNHLKRCPIESSHIISKTNPVIHIKIEMRKKTAQDVAFHILYHVLPVNGLL